MNNSDLDAILKKARLPERPGDFWEFFPRRIVNRLNRPRTETRRARRSFAWWAWGLAAACVMAAFVIDRHAAPKEPNDVLASVKMIDETLALFPNRIRAIVQDEHGMNLVLSDHNDVPSSPPLYVRICDGKHCSSAVTFSGQEIDIDGRKVTVLAQTGGGIILEGRQFVWSSAGSVNTGGQLKIEARNLRAATL